jgi:hypothetical protein
MILLKKSVNLFIYLEVLVLKGITTGATGFTSGLLERTISWFII